jgi:hypothetical protein
MLCACVFFVVFASDSGVASGVARVSEKDNSTTNFQITPEEHAYLETLRGRPIRIAYSNEILQDEQGMLKPVLDVFKDVLGLSVVMIKSSWHTAFTHIENSSIDFYGPLAISEDRSKR